MIFFDSKTLTHVIQTWDENLALLPIVGKSGFVSHTKHTAEATKHESISFKIDNMHIFIAKIFLQVKVLQD